MKIILSGLVQLLLTIILHAQVNESQINALLSGKKNDADQEIIASLGVDSIDVFLDRLSKENDQNKLPLYVKIVGIKYRQFSDTFSPIRKEQILTALSFKIREVSDVPPRAYLIQSSLAHLSGINHPVISQLADVYMRSGDEWTKSAAQALKDSVREKQHRALEKDTSPVPTQQPPIPKEPEAKSTTSSPGEEPASSTPWSIIVVLIVAALGLLWLLLKRRS